jgi:3-dehydroquinate synthase
VPSIPVSTATASYTVHVGSGLLATLARRIERLTTQPFSRLFVITSPEIWRFWSKPFLAAFPDDGQPKVLLLPAGETHKRLVAIERLAEQLAAARADRDSVLIAFGGGIIGDVTGFLAAIYMRGLSFVQVPTTLLAQVDSSVGGKTGVNLRAGKNLIGSFHHPLAVFADTDLLRTLPERELRAGLQESVKAAIIRSPRLFQYLEVNADAVLDPAHPRHIRALTHVITASVRIKTEVVDADEREHGVRMILNFGHTLGHAMEAATGYKLLLHGEAVAWGMIAATRLAVNRGSLDTTVANRIERLIRRYGPLRPFLASATKLVALTGSDKKNRSGVLSFLLPTGVGSVTTVKDIQPQELLDVAHSVLAEAKPRASLRLRQESKA